MHISKWCALWADVFIFTMLITISLLLKHSKGSIVVMLNRYKIRRIKNKSPINSFTSAPKQHPRVSAGNADENENDSLTSEPYRLIIFCMTIH